MQFTVLAEQKSFVKWETQKSTSLLFKGSVFTKIEHFIHNLQEGSVNLRLLVSKLMDKKCCESHHL